MPFLEQNLQDLAVAPFACHLHDCNGMPLLQPAPELWILLLRNVHELEACICQTKLCSITAFWHKLLTDSLGLS